MSTANSSFNNFSGPAWNNFSEYPSVFSNEFINDLKHFDELHEEIKSISLDAQTDINKLQLISELSVRAWTLIGNLSTYVQCENCIDTTDSDSQKMLALMNQKRSALKATLTPTQLLLTTAPESLIKKYLDHEHTKHEAYVLSRARSLADTRLSEKEEALLVKMRTHAIDSFGQLYNQIAGSLRCRIKSDEHRTTEIGLAQAASLLRDPDETRRKNAWNAIQASWKEHESSVASILNGLAGWRIEECRMRSSHRPFDFLDLPIHNAAVRSETLDAMMASIREHKEIGLRANRALSRYLGKSRLDPWDLLADPPQKTGLRHGSRLSFKEGINLIRDSFAAVDSGFADFVDMMNKNRWIEGRSLPSKRQGAFCTSFAKSRTPRVYMTYQGSANDVRTLAHELGHAYHGWVMRDMPLVLRRYPMTLAETASIFSETVVSEHLISKRNHPSSFLMSWQSTVTASTMLLNIPARFSFEKNFYERRLKSAFCPASELSEMTDRAWNEWYGDTISQPESLYWMTKLHFSMPGISFYNFPYSFGYLFSLSIYARREEWGERFWPRYIEILRDTGRMTAEDLAMKHLGEDISKPNFWKKSLAIIDDQVRHFERLVENASSDLISSGQHSTEALS